ncbi:MAG: glycosyl transferase [Candidimonas sp.]|nr:MAG: glycosyl transferase [Candidimonas sp.]TAM25016.1 MAG: glycosyl transferase [Candidimonas sp.]TAM73825.1 MAG: glycosyl transferase [Candidimonas sp.]
MPALPIYVVSLPSASARRDFMRRQFADLKVHYEFFDAIDGRENPDHYLFKKYNDKKRAQRRGGGTPLRLSQLGCFASHYQLWEKCLREDQAMIVLEDDAILLAPFMDFYERTAEFADKYGFVWIEPSNKNKNHKGLVLEQIGPFAVKKFSKGFSHTVGYLLAPAQAKKLLAHCTEWIYPVDNTIDRFFEHKVEAIGVDPICVRPDGNFESTINSIEPTYKRSLQDIIRSEYSSLVDTIKRSIHNTEFFIRHKMR